jgi:ABC-type multidrug transport system fused ATPase/permease subunit
MPFLYLPILIIAIVGGVLFASLSLYFRSRPLAGANIVLAVYLIEILFVHVPPIPLGVQIYPADIVFALLFGAVMFRYAIGMPKLRAFRWILIALFLLYFISVARGFALFGLKQTANEGRGWFYFLTGMAYFSSFSLSSSMRKKLMTRWFVASVLMIVIAMFRWVAVATGVSVGTDWAEGGTSIRVLNSSAAFFLAMAFFGSMFLNLSHRGPKWQRRAFYVLGPVILLLQHRTVWEVMIVGLLWLGLRDARFRKKAKGAIVGMALVGIMMGGFVFGYRSELISGTLRNSATNGDTFLWRVVGWYQLVFNNFADNDNPTLRKLDRTIGQPFGTGYERMVLGAHLPPFTVPHNYYVETYLRLGIVGLFLLILLYVSGMRRMKRMRPRFRNHAYPNPNFWHLVLLSQLCFFLTYGASYDQSILAGAALAGIRLKGYHLKTPKEPCLTGSSSGEQDTKESEIGQRLGEGQSDNSDPV